MAFSINTQWGYFYDHSATLIGHDSADVALWLAAHPGYRSNIWFNFGDFSEDMAVEELFYDEAEREAVAVQVAA